MFAYAKQKQNAKDTVQKKNFVKSLTYSNRTDFPNDMKVHFENHSGFSFDDVRVYYNSDKSARLQATAYAQGNNVYTEPGQEKHLDHELRHVVQQKQGIVEPVFYIGSIPSNTDSVLEKNAGKIFEDVNKAHKTTAQLKGEAGKKQLVNNTIQLIGGRDKDWSKLHYFKINIVYQTLARELVNYYNTKIKKDIERLNQFEFRKNNPILPADHKLVISGSTLVMKIKPDQFVADDIDLDYYNNKFANKIDSIYEPPDFIVWTNLIKEFSHEAFKYENDDFDAEKMDDGESDGGIEKRLFRIHFKDDPRSYYVNVEIKNITTKNWHNGWKTGEKRDIEDNTMETSEKQLYMDTCLRIYDIISAALTMPVSDLKSLQKIIEDSVDAKKYMLKKNILEESLRKKEKYQEAIEMAKAKLEDDIFPKWILISESKDLSEDMIKQYLNLSKADS